MSKESKKNRELERIKLQQRRTSVAFKQLAQQRKKDRKRRRRQARRQYLKGVKKRSGNEQV